MFTDTAPDVERDPTSAGAQRAAPTFPAHPYVTNAEEIAADGLAQHGPDGPTITDDPFLSMADRIRAEGIAEPRHV